VQALLADASRSAGTTGTADERQAAAAAEDTNAAQQAREDNRLPDKAWWDSVSWPAALRLGSTTYVQVPDRFRDAVVTARRKALQVLAAATERGDAATAEWKLTLLFDSLLLHSSETDATCAELLEERLAWWWGGQWSTLWASAAAGRLTPKTLPRTASDKQKAASDKQKAARVHTLASAGELGRALGAVSSARLAPRTTDTF
jgi:hypothetical protein